MNNLQNIKKEKIYEKLKNYLYTKEEILACYVFGSFVKDVVFNDIDVAVLLDEKKNKNINYFYKGIELMVEISLATDVNNIDILILNDAPVIFKYEIIQRSECIFFKQVAQRELFEDLSFKQYHDFLPRLTLYDKYMFKRIKKKGGDENMNSYNKDLVSQRSNMAEGALVQLRALSKLEKEKFVTDPHNLALVEHYLRICIDTLIDLSNHIIVVKGLGRPQSVKDMVGKLKENKVIPEDFAFTCLKFIRLRDRLVHLYWEVEAEEIYQVLENELPKLVDFLTFLLSYIESSS